MKQIKTVIKQISDLEAFDKEINHLSKTGWNLKKRAVISAKGEPNEVGSASDVQLLYAELEKDGEF